MRENWTGFYGPSFRLMLRHADRHDLPDEVWDDAVDRHKDNQVGEGHWEFLAIGYLHLFDRDVCLSDKAVLRLKTLLPRFTSKHRAANWRLMAQIVRRRVAGQYLVSMDLDQVKLRPTNDGFLPDIPNDRSSQYHAFLLFLLMRFSDPTDAVMRSYVVRSFDWLASCNKSYGDPSPLGRGRFQLFGYAAMAAVAALGKRWNLVVPATWHADVWASLDSGDLYGAISPKWDGPHRRYLLHGYNTVEDYPAMTSLMSHGLSPVSPAAVQHDSKVLWWHPLDRFGSGLFADRTGVQASILVSQPTCPATGRRNLLRQLIHREKSANAHPKRIEAAHLLAGSGIRVDEDCRNLDFSWSLGEIDGQVSDITLWSSLPIQFLAVSGSVEYARLEWQHPNAKTWVGFNLRLVRSGSVQLRCKRQ